MRAVTAPRHESRSVVRKGSRVRVSTSGADESGQGRAAGLVLSFSIVLHPQGIRDLDPDEEAVILRRFGFEPDPVIEAYKRDVDRTLLRQNLKRSPEERWRNFAAAVALAEELRRAGASGRGR